MAKVGCTSCAKKRKTAIGKVRRKRRGARVGKLSTGGKIAIAIALVGVGAAVYLKYSGLENKVILEKVKILNFSGGVLNLSLNIVNLSGANINFSGYSGQIIIDDDVYFGSVLIKDQITIPAHGEVEVKVAVSPNVLSLIGIVKDFVNAIKNKDWSQFKVVLDGNIFVGNITIPYKTQIA